jgi:hypothetical protein
MESIFFSCPTGKLFLTVSMDAEEQLPKLARLNCAPAARQLRKEYRAGPPMAKNIAPDHQWHVLEIIVQTQLFRSILPHVPQLSCA